MGSWLVLQGGGRRLSVRGGAFLVEYRGEPVRTLRPQDVEEVHSFGDVEITPAARRRLLHQGIDVVFHTRDGRVQGRLSGQQSRAGERRLAQLRLVLDPSQRLAVARAVVAGKIGNQHAMVRRVQRRARSEPCADALAALRAYATMAECAEGLDVLRGVEGIAARVYFGVLGQGITNPLFTFTGRNRRPPRDPVNAVLSFLYTLLAQRAEAAVRGAGLDPFVGFVHDAGRGHAACAFDLMEEWRPLVDRMALTLFNRRQLAPEDFRDPGLDPASLAEPLESLDRGDRPTPADPRPAVHLAPVGRSVVLTAWARWTQERVWSPVREARFPREDLIRHQAQQLARCCEDPTRAYHPFAWS